MQINIGDKVRFLNDVGGGIVTRIIDANQVMVLNEEDDFEIPTLKSELVVVESKTKKTSQSNDTTNHLVTHIPESVTRQNPLLVQKDDIYMAFVPNEGEDVTESPMEVYLINDSDHILLYSFHEEIRGNYQGVTAGHVDPRSKIVLKDYANKDLGELSSYLFQFIFYQKGIYTLKVPIEKQVKIHPVKFYKASSFKESHYFTQKVMLTRLTSEDTDQNKDIDLEQDLDKISSSHMKKIIREKERPVKSSASTPSIKGKDDILEVDLHINALLDSVLGLSNADILEYQMKEFHNVLRSNKENKGKRIVFIHGIGNGTLKKKIYDELRRKYRRYSQQDASFKEYGWGATMVTIR